MMVMCKIISYSIHSSVLGGVRDIKTLLDRHTDEALKDAKHELASYFERAADMFGKWNAVVMARIHGTKCVVFTKVYSNMHRQLSIQIINFFADRPSENLAVNSLCTD